MKAFFRKFHNALFPVVCCAFLFASALPLRADDPDAIIFTGTSGDEQTYKLADYDTLTFFDNQMELSSATNPSLQHLVFNYSDFNHVTFGKNQSSSVEDVSCGDSLIFNAAAARVEVVGDKADDYEIVVFSLLGVQAAHGSGSVDVSRLLPGTYIAVSHDGVNYLKLKFVKQ